MEIAWLGERVSCQLDDSEMSLVREWIAKHICEKRLVDEFGWTNFYIKFFPSNIGNACSVGCNCGQELDITDYGRL